MNDLRETDIEKPMKPMALEAAVEATTRKERVKEKKDWEEQGQRERRSTMDKQGWNRLRCYQEDLLMNETVPVNNEEQRVMLKIGIALFGEPAEVGGPVESVVTANRKVILKMGPPIFSEPQEVMGSVDPMHNANRRAA